MPRVVITHDVVDVDSWLRFTAERAQAAAGLGASHVVDHAAHDGSNSVALTFDTDDVAGFLAAIAKPSPELAAAMERHGVVPPLMVYVQQ